MPTIRITDFLLFNKTVQPNDSFKALTNDILFTKKIDLAYNQNFFSFNFSVLNYVNSEKNIYAYRLKNFDQDWIYTDSKRRYASYTGIKPGNYIFEVKGANNDGLWNNTPVEVEIIVHPPFWETWWFRIVAFLIISLASYFIITFRLRKIKQEASFKAETEKEISEAKLVALRAQMNPHFLFNSLNSIQQYIYSNEKDEASKYLSKFAKLIRKILQSSAQNSILLEEEINMLSLYLELEAMRFQNKFDFDFEVDEDVEPEFMEIPTMLIQPFLENSILHGLATKEGKGHLSIGLKDIGNHTLEVVIQDDGIGRRKALKLKEQKLFKSDTKSQHKSMGMEVTNSRLSILNKQAGQNVVVNIEDLEDENQIGLGTKVTILIPYQDA